MNHANFAEALAAAIEAKGISLGILSRSATERGAKVSTATLSYWLSGKTQPRRRASLQVVSVIEELCGVPAGSLVQHLDIGESSWKVNRPAAAQFAPSHPDINRIRESWGHDEQDGLDRMVVLARIEFLQLHTVLSYRMVLRANRDGADRFLFAATAHATRSGRFLGEVQLSRGGTMGRRSTDAPGIILYEVLLPQPLAEGESAVVEFFRAGPGSVQDIGDFTLVTLRPIEVLSIQTHFPEDAVPEFVTSITERTDLTGKKASRRRKLRLRGSSAQATMTQVEMGRVSIEWIDSNEPVSELPS